MAAARRLVTEVLWHTMAQRGGGLGTNLLRLCGGGLFLTASSLDGMCAQVGIGDEWVCV